MRAAARSRRPHESVIIGDARRPRVAPLLSHEHQTKRITRTQPRRDQLPISGNRHRPVRVQHRRSRRLRTCRGHTHRRHHRQQRSHQPPRQQPAHRATHRTRPAPRTSPCRARPATTPERLCCVSFRRARPAAAAPLPPPQREHHAPISREGGGGANSSHAHFDNSNPAHPHALPQAVPAQPGAIRAKITTPKSTPTHHPNEPPRHSDGHRRHVLVRGRRHLQVVPLVIRGGDAVRAPAAGLRRGRESR